MRVDIAQEIPGGTRPLGHGIGLALSGAAAVRAGGVDPIGHRSQRGFAGIGGHIVIGVGQGQRELILRQRHAAALLAPDHRNGFAPVALTGEHPVAELEVDLLLADALLGQVFDHLFLRIRHAQPIQEAGIDHHAVCNVGISLLGHVAAGNHLDHRQAEFMGKLPVARIVRRNRHNRAGAVGDQYIVGHPDRDLAAVDGVDGGDAVQAHAGLVLVQLRALEVGLLGRLLLIGTNRIDVLDEIRVLFDDGMLRGDDHVGRTEERIRARGVDAQGLIQSLDLEVQFSALGTTDPVALLSLDLLNEIHVVQAVEQLLSVIGDFQHPLGLDLVHNLAAAALADAVDDLFVGQADLTPGAPVDGHLRLIRQTVLVELKEDPLRPLIVAGIGGVDLAVPIKAEAQHLELLTEMIDVSLSDNSRMNVVLNGEVFSGQAESIPADGEQHVIALQALFAADDIHGRVRARMTDVQSGSRRIGELDQRIVLGLGKIVAGGKGLFLVPDLLPFLFNGSKIIRRVGHDKNLLKK